MARTRVGRVSYPRANADVPAEKPAPAEGGPMPKAQLRERIQELLGELEQIEEIDQGARDRLASVLHEIREAVGGAGEEASDEHESLLERLNEATETLQGIASDAHRDDRPGRRQPEQPRNLTDVAFCLSRAVGSKPPSRSGETARHTVPAGAINAG